MKNGILIIAVVTIAAIVGLYIPYVRTQQVPIAPVSTRGPVVIVNYTNAGFDPKTLTVQKGTTIEWVNVSNKLMWVASDPHPSHTDLPGFDERGVEGNQTILSTVPLASAHIAPSEYLYTFETAGRWRYHNHLIPTDRGEIVVEE